MLHHRKYTGWCSNKKMNEKFINYLIIILILVMAVIIIWAFDLQEILIKEKRAYRIRIIRADTKQFIEKFIKLSKRASEPFRQLMPYILLSFKWLLHLAIKIFKIIGRIWKWLATKLKELFQNYEDKNQQILPALLLMPEENLELPKVLDRHPYSSPVLENVYLDHYFAVSYKISAAGTARQYKDTAMTELKPIITNTIRNFIASKRQVKAYVHIIAATPTYLHFTITYTAYGQNRLLQIYPPLDAEAQQAPIPALEETIPEEDDTVEKDCKNGDKMPW